MNIVGKRFFAWKIGEPEIYGFKTIGESDQGVGVLIRILAHIHENSYEAVIQGVNVLGDWIDEERVFARDLSHAEPEPAKPIRFREFL